MLKKILSSIIIFLFLILQFCTTLKYEVIPDTKKTYNSVKAKIYFKNSDFRFSGKILLKFDNSRDKILFLSPMNQIYFKLIIKGEKTLFINLKKKKYWQGNFNILFKKMSKVNFEYNELKKLILKGDIPENKIKEHGLELSFSRNKISKKPEKIKITGREVLIRLKILDIRKRKGRISFIANLKNLKRTNIDDILRNN